jgi:phospholipid/cholesterol/gamma-HCH transport system ATP-binding protein
LKKPLIKIENLVTQFGDHVVHDGVNLTIYEGEIYGILGGSGSGKTTILREVIMLHEPTAGKVNVLDYDLYSASHEEQQRLRNHWGVLFQFGALFTSLTIAENIAVKLKEYTHISDSLIEDIIATKLEMVGLDLKVSSLYPSELSGGMVKRAALARALAMDPKLLFLDEPTSGLDPISAEQFDNLIVQLKDLLGLTIVMVTHDIDSIFTVVDRMAVLGNKKVVAEGTIDEVVQVDHPFIRQFFGGNRAMIRRKHGK